MRQNPRLCAVGLVGALVAGSFNVWAEPALDLAQMRAAHEAGNTQLVLELALKQLELGEGDPEFDFYYGVAAVDSGALNQGVFALERVLLANPDDLRARLELARAYFLMREDSRAQQEFAEVLAQNPSGNVQANIQRFTDAMRLREGRCRPTSTAYVELGVGHDSNVASSTDNDVLLFGFFTSNSSENSDKFSYVRGGATYNKPFSPGRSFFSSVDVESRHNENDDEFDTNYINAIAGLSFLQGTDRYRISLQGQKYNVGESNFEEGLLSDSDDTFRQMFAINGEWQRTVNRSTQVSLFAQLADMHYPGAASEVRDSWQLTVGAGATHVVTNDEVWVKRLNPVIFGSSWVGVEHSDVRGDVAQSQADREFAGLRGGIRVLPTAKLSIDASAMYQWTEYNKANAIFVNSSGAITREDDFYMLSLGAKYLLTDAIVLGGELTYTTADSNVGLNDYDRTQARGYVRYNFN
ncbi:MAG: tetratricopeptide repeat protein [Immundisolibacteraceae bacterium]|nr:tetratricopeptide repeat protein [Immundisolibacteraceae bacterium]